MRGKAESSAVLMITANTDGTAIQISGALTFASVAAGIDAFKPYCLPGQENPLVVDFSQITHTDSAGLAFLLHMKRMAHAVGRPIQFLALPEQTRNLAAVFGIADLLDSGNAC